VALDVAFVVDGSRSIFFWDPIDAQWDAFKMFMEEILKSIKIGPGESSIQVGIVEFSTAAQTIAYLDEYNQEGLVNVFRGLEASMGLTNTSGALRQTRLDIFTTEHGDRPCE
jgi:hypothetical protein